MSLHAPSDSGPARARVGLSRRFAGLAAIFALAGACRASATRSPEDLRRAYLEAVENDDPDTAYELLSDDVRSQVDRETFRSNWAARRTELEQTASSIRALDEDERQPVWYGETLHPSGRRVNWVLVDGRYRVIDGLPGLADLSTPERTVAALITRLRATDHDELSGVITDDLAQRIDQRWRLVASQIETALADPRALEISEDGSRAVLLYGEGKHLVLRRIGPKWRVDELE